MKKSAFTMLELIFVIVIIGILAAAIIPRMDRDTMFEASEQVMSHIRYTQHLAMTDDVYSDTNATWHKQMWQITFNQCTANSGFYYIVYSDRNQLGGPNENEAAADPHTGLLLFSTNACNEDDPDHLSDVIISEKYGIDNVVLSGGCFVEGADDNNFVAFDQYGRPHYKIWDDAVTLADSDCVIRLEDGADFAEITIERETGYVHRTAISN